MKYLSKKELIGILIFTLLFWIPHSYFIISGTNFTNNPNSIHSSIHKDFKSYFDYKKINPTQNDGERYIKYSELPIKTMIALDCLDIKSDYSSAPDLFIKSYLEKIPDTDEKKLYSDVDNSINNLFNKYSKESKKYIYIKIILRILIAFLFYFAMFYISAIEFDTKKKS